MSSTRCSVRATLFLPLVAASPALAEWPEVAASLGYSPQYVTARGFDLVGDDDHLAMFRVGGAVTVPVSQGSLDLEAAFHTGTSLETAHQAVSTSLTLTGVEAGATWRYPLYRHLHPYLHLGAGWDWATLSLVSADRLTQTVGQPQASGLLGVQVPVELTQRQQRRLTFVLDVGAGYVLRPGYAFTELGPTAPSKPGPDPIPTGKVSLGVLPLSGFSGRVLVGLRL